MLSPLINTGNERAELQAALRWDYTQLGDAAETVIEHTIEIKRNERRANDAVVEAGRHLIAVKETLAHGQWGDWLDTEFNMSDRTARTLMSIAERFDGKTEMISDLSVTILGLLAAPSTPAAAVDAVIEANQQQPVRVADVKAIIADHKPTVDPWQSAATATGSRQKRIEYLAAAIRPWLENYTDGYGRDWQAIDARGNVAHTNSLLWTDIGREAQRRNAVINGDLLKEAIKLAFAWLRAAAAPSAINNQQSPVNNLPPREEIGDPSRTLDRFVRQDALDNAPDTAPRPSPLAPSPYKSLAQMDADGEIPPLAPRPSQPDTYASVHPIQNTLRPLTGTYTAADLRTTANYRGGSRWFEARRLLAAAGIHYRDRDLVQALNNLADELEQRDRTQPAQPPTDAPRPALTTAEAADLLRPTIDDFYRNEDSRRYRVPDMQAAAQTNSGGVWRACERALANYTYTSALLMAALRLIADELKQSEPSTSSTPSTPSTDAKQPGFVPIKIADDRIPRCRRLIGIYNQAISVEDEYGDLTGCYSETTATKRELQKLIDRLQRTIDLLEGKAVAAEECD